MSDEEKAPEKFAGWEEQSRVYREIWLNATPAQRLRKLQEMIEFARMAAAANQTPLDRE
jgi:hypothetical protein